MTEIINSLLSDPAYRSALATIKALGYSDRDATYRLNEAVTARDLANSLDLSDEDQATLFNGIMFAIPHKVSGIDKYFMINTICTASSNIGQSMVMDYLDNTTEIDLTIIIAFWVTNMSSPHGGLMSPREVRANVAAMETPMWAQLETVTRCGRILVEASEFCTSIETLVNNCNRDYSQEP